jgi:FADH2 O2-dependent halogenase
MTGTPYLRAVERREWSGGEKVYGTAPIRTVRAVSADFDLAIVGSGFAGSLLAMVARRLGLSVLMIERGRHPRFAIGESSTPLANLWLETLADRYDLPRLRPLSQWGTWQASYPRLGCGLKRGFSYFHHAPGRGWEGRSDRSDQLLVAASPNDFVADTHWYRPDFDAFLVAEAVALGVEYLDETTLESCEFGAAGVGLKLRRGAGSFSGRAGLLVDASGPRGFLQRTLAIPETPFEDYPRTRALFSHFTDVARWDEVHRGFDHAPFAPDDAALHHTFEGGWMWVLRFNNGITSAGFAECVPGASDRNAECAPDRDAAGPDAPQDGLWNAFLERFPSIGAQFCGATRIRDWSLAEPLAFRTTRCAGPRWVQLPMAAGFVDPLFSTGFVLSLLGIDRLARALERGGSEPDFRAYEADTLADLDATARLIGGAYRVLGRPEAFEALSMLYFAAASFSETALRLGTPGLAPGFLLRDHPQIGPAFRGLLAEAGRALETEWIDRVARTMEPVNIAGLCQPGKGHWYGVETSDLLAGADKLQSSPEALREMLRQCGL